MTKVELGDELTASGRLADAVQAQHGQVRPSVPFRVLASLQPAGAGSERDDAIRATADKLLEEVAVRRAFLEDQKAQGRAPEEFESVRQGIYERLDRLDALVGARASR